MRPGTWNGAVSTDNVRVTVNGTVRPVKDVRIQSGMRDGHPAAESGSWCVEATIEWEDPALVTADSPHLFGGTGFGDRADGATDWLPKAGDRVVIETGDGATGQWWVQHRGVIDDTTGSISGGTAQSTTVDNIEDLSGRVQFGALLHRMTAWADGHEDRHIGLSSIYMVDRMYRNPQTEGIGWYATPPMTWQAIASAPMNGSAWPELGTLRACGRSQSEPNQSIAGWTRTSYGVAPHGIFAEYLFTDSANTWTGDGVVFTCSTEQSFLGVVRYRLHSAEGYGVFVRIRGDTGVIQYGIETTGTAQWEMPLGNAKRVAIRFRRTSHTSQTLTIRTDDGREETRTGASSQFPNGYAMDRLYVGTGTSGHAGWWMVEHEKPRSQRWATLHSTPTARLRRASEQAYWSASRDLPFTMPSEWLAEQVDAECAQMWLDEDNHMQWASRGVLEAQRPVATITSVRDVDDIQWEQRRSALARSVWVNYREPRINRGYRGAFSREFWSNDNVDVGPGEEEIITIAVPDDEDWISVDLNPHHVSRYGRVWSHYVNGSIYGGTQYTASDSSGGAWALFLNCTMARHGLREFEVRYSPWSTIGSGQRVKSSYPPNPNALMRNGASVLALRGRGHVKWVDRETSVNAGPIGPARFTHDVDWRVQNYLHFTAVDDLRDWIREQVQDSTKPRVTGLTIAHDPRLQVGDKIRIRDTEITGIDFDMLIQQRDVNVGDMTETIEGRVTRVLQTQNYGPGAPAESRLEPGGSTALTPDADWDREDY